MGFIIKKNSLFLWGIFLVFIGCCWWVFLLGVVVFNGKFVSSRVLCFCLELPFLNVMYFSMVFYTFVIFLVSDYRVAFAI